VTALFLAVSGLGSSAAVAADYGVFKSNDGGRSWIRSDAGLPSNSRVNAFGSWDETLLAGTDTGIFVSGENARSWRPASGVALTSGRIVGFATLRGKVFAGTDGAGILVSADGGSMLGRAARFAGSRPARSYRWRSRPSGVYYSEDRGRTWIRAQTGLPAESPGVAFLVERGLVLAGLASVSSATD
jgi:hypothetical protein